MIPLGLFFKMDLLGNIIPEVTFIREEALKIKRYSWLRLAIK